jgi:formylglycine-generating enzyme required for sulfatase activity
VKDIPDADLRRFPVESVSWDDCQAFCDRLNTRAEDRGWVYRLPTGVEWEYACRGGHLSDRIDSGFDFYFDKPSLTLTNDQANFGNVLKRASRVGTYQPNALGAFDLHGNVWEWTLDEAPPDPSDPQPVARRFSRGGCWYFDSATCRAGGRGFTSPPSIRLRYFGLRLARVPVGTAPVRLAGKP